MQLIRLLTKKIVKLVANGSAVIADSYVTPRAYTLPPRDGFASDQAKLRGDVDIAVADIRKAIDKHGKSAYRTTRQK